MSDVREALVALLNHPDHAPMSTHDPRDGSCRSCPWPLHEMPPEDIAGAILAEFDVAPRGEGQWWESLVEAPCDQGHRIFIDDGDGGVYACPACALLPSVEDVARAILMATQVADVDPDYAWSVQYPEVQDELLDQARAVLALFPGRTEAEVYREGYDQGLRDAASASRSEAEVKAEALRDAAQDVRLCWTGTTNLRDQDDPERFYSFDCWLEVRAEHLANGGA